MSREGIDQIPVLEDENFVGSVMLRAYWKKIIQDPLLQTKDVFEVMKANALHRPDSTLECYHHYLTKTIKRLGSR